ncbi:tropomodulin-2 [Eurytemora carolleeae]|uniref:tropomodulin-2 n=1 Tax=Eurytemora carolleeae TaxID=1294199 RepID=UPI000C7689AF|nr:tropomodulin-2 [Eurytemora carolleeae]XP_023337351.1 tropomodulin-2 [Eurytemora carolleeae]|eukprot:XP_023337339.1 tropomodulin-2-like [Eurytemora affinis]
MFCIYIYYRSGKGSLLFKMSSIITNRGMDYADLDIDELVDKLTPGEIQKLLEDCDPDDSQIPPGLRSNYRCEKEATGPFDKKKLNDFITEQAINEPDIPDVVPHVPGTVRGKRYTAPSRPKPTLDDDIEISLDLGEDVEIALNSATTDEIVDLAGIMGLHALMNQDQYHASQSEKAPRADPDIGWQGVTKASPLKPFPAEAPNKTEPAEVLEKIKCNDPSLVSVNLNNVYTKENQFIEMFQALEQNTHLKDLSLANTGMTDTAAAVLASALEVNKTLETINFESNNVNPQTIAKMFEAINVQQTLLGLKGSNQQAQFLGNKVETAITKAIENNKAILRVGLHFQFGDCRNRVAVQLQKNLDRLRLKRIAHKLSNAGSD